VKRVASPEGEFMPFTEASRIGEMLTVDRHKLHAWAKHAVEQAHGQQPTPNTQLTRSHLD
jgi:hypothetical protein